MDPTTKHQKAILKNLVLHIYKGKNTHLNTAIGQLVVGAFFFNMRSCGYSTTHKREGNLTRILQKGDIRFYRECHELSHNSGILHLDDKVSQTFHTQKKRSQKCHSDAMADGHNPLRGAHLDRKHHPTGLILRKNTWHTSEYFLGRASNKTITSHMTTKSPR